MLKKQGPFAIGRAVRLTCQLLDALTYAHEAGFVHRDIKPANLLIAGDDGQESAKLADFGLARVYHDSQLSGFTLAGEIGGTCGFMSPEQILNFREVQPAADQYGVAASLYNLLTGKFILDLPLKDFQKGLLMILHDEPVPLQERRPEVPDELARIVHRALAKQPAKRFAHVRALRDTLTPFGGGG
jgi:serine/threonine-protein kinase